MTSQQSIRFVIVDDHAMLRKGLAAYLMDYVDLKLVGEASNGKEAISLCIDQCPDVVLMDLMMPLMDGVTATRLICLHNPKIQVIALTSFGEEDLIKRVLEAGAISYLFKKVSADDLANAIRAANDGFSTFASEVTDLLVHSLQKPKPLFKILTSREREVLALMVKGMGNKEIANHLTISLSTTKSHVGSILLKFSLTSRVEAITMVMEDSFHLGDFYIK